MTSKKEPVLSMQEMISHAKQTAAAIAAKFVDPTHPDSPLAESAAQLIQLMNIQPKKGEPDKFTEAQTRLTVADILKDAKFVVSELAVGIQKENPLACKGYSKEDLGRLDRYLDLAADYATLNIGKGKTKKFYTAQDIASVANLQLRNEIEMGAVPAAKEGCDINAPVPLPALMRMRGPGISV